MIAEDELLPPFGPFYRLESATQTPGDARRQQLSGEIWGRAPRNSDWPQVQAYVGRLPGDRRGVEFFTSVAPDPSGHPHEARWSGGGRRPGVVTDGEFAKIPVMIVRNTQQESL